MQINDIYMTPNKNILFFLKMKNILIEEVELYNRLYNLRGEINNLKSINNVECEFILKYNNNISNLKHINSELNKDILLLDDYINKNCNHEWITDFIDINLDNLINIEYCKICETNKLQY
jgi:hypothetical protein